MTDATTLATAFKLDIGTLAVVKRRLRQKLGEYLLARGLKLFVRNGDSISLDPLVNGDWDLLVVNLLRYAAGQGYDRFLIDIGANIGLTASQCGDDFREVLMFEPNPEIFAILDVNTRMALQRSERRLFPYGLGPERKSAVLLVPPGNWGAAFVRDEHNSHTDEVIAHWHQVPEFDRRRYREVPIRIEAVREVLPPLFDDLCRKGATRGAIKIDVEGYERSILKEIGAILPPAIELFIVFENWGDTRSIADVAEAFGRPVRAYSVERTPRPRGNLTRDLPAMLLRGGTKFRLSPLGVGRSDGGEIVLVVDAIGDRRALHA